MDIKQKQTENIFSYKWAKEDTYESEEFKKNAYDWEVERYFGSEEKRTEFFEKSTNKSFLDAGCGSGFSAEVLFSEYLKNIEYTGVDISDAVWIAKHKLEKITDTNKIFFYQDNIETMNLNKQYDFIFSEGVIHHTSNPYNTFQNLTKHLKVGGTILFYVYKKKAPLREFTDDYIRETLKDLSNDEAWEKLIPLTKLGKKLGEIHTNIEIDEDIDLLGIKKGTYDLQRFFYWFVAKAYYKENYSIEEMNHINFDWYRPTNCYRYDPEEIKMWLKNNNYITERFIVEDAGITVVATKEKEA